MWPLIAMFLAASLVLGAVVMSAAVFGVVVGGLLMLVLKAVKS